MDPDHEHGAAPLLVPVPAWRRAGLSTAGVISGLGGIAALGSPVLETVTIVLGVIAVVTGAGAWRRSVRPWACIRVAASIGILLGAIALTTAIHRVDKTIIEIDEHQVEQRR